MENPEEVGAASQIAKLDTTAAIPAQANLPHATDLLRSCMAASRRPMAIWLDGAGDLLRSVLSVFCSK
jgi:hypothetical protein